jgi:hypothetical protein
MLTMAGSAIAAPVQMGAWVFAETPGRTLAGQLALGLYCLHRGS